MHVILSSSLGSYRKRTTVNICILHSNSSTGAQGVKPIHKQLYRDAVLGFPIDIMYMVYVSLVVSRALQKQGLHFMSLCIRHELFYKYLYNNSTMNGSTDFTKNVEIFDRRCLIRYFMSITLQQKNYIQTTRFKFLYIHRYRFHYQPNIIYRVFGRLFQEGDFLIVYIIYN